MRRGASYDRERASVILLLLRRMAAFLLIAALPLPALAAVEIHFYSRELGGNNFPHAFVHLKGTVDATGEPVDIAYGFTARTVSPAILMGSVTGDVVVETAAQIAASQRQFSLTLTDEQYGRVLAAVERWRRLAQPSYNLNRRNCVHFVGEMAEAVGLAVTYDPRLMKRPRSFLVAVREANGPRLAARAP
jgi:hypothetical protein